MQLRVAQTWISCWQESLVFYNATVLINVLQALMYWDRHGWVRRWLSFPGSFSCLQNVKLGDNE